MATDDELIEQARLRQREGRATEVDPGVGIDP
jgi:hypothetical protein